MHLEEQIHAIIEKFIGEKNWSAIADLIMGYGVVGEMATDYFYSSGCSATRSEKEKVEELY